MVIILKFLCFGIWLLMMSCLIRGSRMKVMPPANEVRLKLEDEEKAEMCIRAAFKRLKPEDRLVIEGLPGNEVCFFIIDRIIARNPSVLCIFPGSCCI